MSSYACSNCGHEISPAQNVCPHCGSELAWDEVAGRVRYVSRLPRLGPARGPRFRTLLITSALLLLVFGAVLAAGWWGVEQGMEQRRAMLGEAAFAHYRQGVQLLLDGRIVDARAEFAEAVAQRPPAAPGPDATPVPAADSTPTPPAPVVSGPDETALDEALARIQTAMDAGAWRQAIDQLRALREQAPDYQPGLLGQMLFNAHYNLALDLETAGSFDQAAYQLGEALVLRPGNTAASHLKRDIDLYRTGLAALDRDWDAAITAFSELFALNPDYLDTPDQLFLAYTGHGDSLRRSDPCLAVERYQLALQLESDPQIRAKLEDARLRCTDAGATPVAVGGPTPKPLSGQLAYTFFDDEQTFHVTQFWDLDVNEQGERIAVNALQPDVNSKGEVVVRSTDADGFGLTLYTRPGAAGRRLTRDAGDSLPRWSPDDAHILFTSSSRSDDKQPHLYLLEAATRQVEDLGRGSGGGWSPDGTRIAFQGCDEAGEACGLWVLTLAGGRRRQLTTVASDSMPVWSPDGRSIAFMSAGRTPSWDIFVADADSGNVPVFSLDDANDGLPVWLPDGRTVAFLSDREGDWAVYAWSLGDLSVNRLFPVPGSLPDWRQAGLAWTP